MFSLRNKKKNYLNYPHYLLLFGALIYVAQHVVLIFAGSKDPLLSNGVKFAGKYIH